MTLLADTEQEGIFWTTLLTNTEQAYNSYKADLKHSEEVGVGDINNTGSVHGETGVAHSLAKTISNSSSTTRCKFTRYNFIVTNYQTLLNFIIL